MIELNKIYNESCVETMSKMPDESINMVMTSPPYWALRDYGTGDDQLGLEPTFDKYISNLCDIFDEVKRVLRKDGTCWVNLGDSYNSGGNYRVDNPEKDKNNKYFQKGSHKIEFGRVKVDPQKQGISAKSLTMIPYRFAIEMVNRGWILRNTIIWHKRNCMPSSAKDRFTVDFEYIFFFVKNKKYWFEQQFDKHESSQKEIGRQYSNGIKETDYATNKKYSGGVGYGEQGRNKRTVWTINPKPFSEAHFAVYPEELCETPIKAGCPEFVCKKCGKPREKIFDKVGENKYNEEGKNRSKIKWNDSHPNYNDRWWSTDKEVGLSDCGCNEGFSGGIVYDPFGGSGTTGKVAHRLNRKFIISEMKKEYCKIAEKRLAVTKQERFA